MLKIRDEVALNICQFFTKLYGRSSSRKPDIWKFIALKRGRRLGDALPAKVSISVLPSYDTMQPICKMPHLYILSFPKQKF